MRVLFFLFISIQFPCFAQSSVNSSVLKKGNFYKFSVSQKGIYKLDYHFLKAAGIPVDELNPETIKIYGNPGGMLPQLNSETRIEDLQEIAILFQGKQTKKFGPQDYLLIPANGPDRQVYDIEKGVFRVENNLYSRKNFFFLTYGGNKGKRVLKQEKMEAEELPVIAYYNDYLYHEINEINLLSSGREWFGEKFSEEAGKEKIFVWKIPGINRDKPLKIGTEVLSRASISTDFRLSANGTDIGTITLQEVPKTTYGNKAVLKSAEFEIKPTEIFDVENLHLKFEFLAGNDDAESHLNYFWINCERKISVEEPHVFFRSLESLNFPKVTYQIENVGSKARIWDITNPQEIKEIPFDIKLGKGEFADFSDTIKEYAVFYDSDLTSPKFEGRVDNQNLHGLSTPDFLIITVDSLKASALKLAGHRKSHDQLETEVVVVDQIYNEFSSGRKDVTAIRDFIRMLYKRGENHTLKYVLLFGKTTFDPLGIRDSVHNQIPIYQSYNSIHAIHSFSSDDYFTFMEEEEGNWEETTSYGNKIHDMDLGIGRIPVSTKVEAANIVEKIIHYDQAVCLGGWRNKLAFVADDSDENKHQLRSDYLATEIEQVYPDFIPDRVFVDAFPQEATRTGKISPLGQEKVDYHIGNGVLIMDYIGHGAETGWTNEKILTLGQISGWNNLNNLPLMVTATCEFGRFDDWKRKSAAEEALLKKDGGAIGLLTTTRPVISNTNFDLSQAFYQVVFEKKDGEFPRLGDIFMDTKNNSISGNVNRNFALLADPSITLAIPSNKVNIHKIDHIEINHTDTLVPGKRLLVEGKIADLENKSQKRFEGRLMITIYGEKTEVTTLGDDGPKTKMTYENRQNIIYNGSSTISKGEFSFELILPQTHKKTHSKIFMSLYALDSLHNSDAMGTYQNFILGPKSNAQPGNIKDTIPPEISLYLDNELFQSGGDTGPTPILLANFNDESGINTNAGIKVLIDDNESEALDLSRYYQSEVNDFTTGALAYQLQPMDLGLHSLTLVASDNFNNETNVEIFFNVVDGIISILENLIVHPNPSHDSVNFSFPVSELQEDFRVSVKIMDAEGILVKEIMGNYSRESADIQSIRWDGLDNYGNRFASGTYFYEIYIDYQESGRNDISKGKFILLN
ncbi:type IX secretion system sortase PorU [Flexithrix dorotheae]|uniref:type IX secretion system sortase PorU n=1 Tax=Flexithrix dorotheae TaxID=70993 RepID=UPI000377BE6A|nr:type IX secretion system sortase PorU [Flexithrix dorotheae]